MIDRLTHIYQVIENMPASPACVTLWRLAAELLRQLDRPALILPQYTVRSDAERANECERWAAQDDEYLYLLYAGEVN